MRKGVSIKKFIYFWLGGLVCCFLTMASAMVLSTSALRSMNAETLKDAGAVEMAHRLENGLLEERRMALLLHDTGDPAFSRKEKVLMEQSRSLIEELSMADRPAKDRPQVNDIFALFQEYRTGALSLPPQPLPAINKTADRLLAAVEKYREDKRAQMTETLARSKHLDTLVDRWSLGVIISVVLASGLGSVLLLRRIVRPARSLSQTATRFGEGETMARATVYFNDEMGLLSRSFNEMADNIAALHQERGHLIAALAHDLKNPLVLIGGAARRLKRKEAVAQNQLPLLDSIIGQTEAMEELIGELVETVRQEETPQPQEMTDVDLHELLKTLHARQAPLITSHRLHYEGSPCPVRGDASRLGRIATNLISNAVKYSAAGTPIHIRLQRQEDWGVLTVTDAGVGIPASEIPRLFEPFRRLEHTRSMAKGTGLGLFSARKIVSGHGGSISISSQLGTGTTVTVKLPLNHAPAPQPGHDHTAVTDPGDHRNS